MAKSTELKLIEEILILRSYIEFPQWTVKRRAQFLKVSTARVSRVLDQCSNIDELKETRKNRLESLRQLKRIEKNLYSWSKVMNTPVKKKVPRDWRTTFR